MCLPKKDKSAALAAQQQAEREAQRRNNITAGTQAIDNALGGFDDNYFVSRQNAYVDNALPALNQQFSDAQKQLIYALSRSGLMQSSEAADRQRRLNEERGRYERDIQNNAINFANQGRTNLENTRSNLLSQLTATEDPTATATAAAAQAQLLNAPPTFDPLQPYIFNTVNSLENLNASTGGRGLLNRGATANISPASGTKSVRYTTS